MKRVNPNEAPKGYVARAGQGVCKSKLGNLDCDLLLSDLCRKQCPSCIDDRRKDGRLVIFKKKEAKQ